MEEINSSATSFLNDLESICLHTYIAIVSTQLNSFKYSYLTLIILFNINYLFAHSEMVPGMAGLDERPERSDPINRQVVSSSSTYMIVPTVFFNLLLLQTSSQPF